MLLQLVTAKVMFVSWNIQRVNHALKHVQLHTLSGSAVQTQQGLLDMHTHEEF